VSITNVSYKSVSRGLPAVTLTTVQVTLGYLAHRKR
jgi:hypothetical protein